jgi:hypothetical protein
MDPLMLPWSKLANLYGVVSIRAEHLYLETEGLRYSATPELLQLL